MLVSRRQRRLTWAAWGLLVLTPFLVVGVLSLLLGKNGFQSHPDLVG